METPSRQAFITNIRMGPTAPEKGKGKEKGAQLPGAGVGRVAEVNSGLAWGAWRARPVVMMALSFAPWCG